MPKTAWTDLTITLDDEQRVQLARDWLWLTNEPLIPLFATAMGDFFARGTDDAIWFVDTQYGTTSHAADSMDELMAELAQSEDEWLYADLVSALLRSGRRRQSDQCFSFVLPLMLGGDANIANVEPCELLTHSILNAQIAKQIGALAPAMNASGVRRIAALDAPEADRAVH